MGIAYLYSMIFHPILSGGGSWHHIGAVWYDWQALNVGVLAFAASLVAFNISAYNSEQQRRRDFRAAQAFLPDALSELTRHFRTSAAYLKQAVALAKPISELVNAPRQPVNLPILPSAPTSFRTVFRDSIQKAEPEVGEYLARILRDFQIHETRMIGLHESAESANGFFGHVSTNILGRIVDLGELQARVNNIFSYARAVDGFNGRHPTFDDFIQAYVNMNIHPEAADGLITATKRRVAKFSEE
ncbi:MAG: hypothetical protein NXH81_14605 [Halieaceae bacterium]|uniref:hypothetical protein n=1 Tax=Haliea alexandrii TaxID=2448162 RepID=UPI000F0B0628|nr:hypothetical protein [Haliea alexandrii]MCR9186626.1 hypothetical protein [Halieaceae bacterium]